MADGTGREERDDELLRLVREASDEGPIPRLAPAHRASLWRGVVAATADDAPTSAGRGTRHGYTRRLLGLASAGVAAGLVGLAVALAPIGGDPAVVLASAELAPLQDDVAPATARVTDADGERVVELALPDVDTPAGTHLEVWLLAPDGSDPLPLGPLASDGRHTVAPGVDLSSRSVLDVSLEPDDGDPTHSGHSLLRGDLVPMQG